MDRKHFLKTLGLLPFSSAAMKLNALEPWAMGLRPTNKMPVLFLGHGSPMNAIEENEFVRGFWEVAQTLPLPQAILCISAHWETRGTFVTAMEHPRTIHDFGGFPQALFEVQYPAPGSPILAKETQALLTQTEVGLDLDWGLDHGAWSVIKHLFPAANIPVVQMSLDYRQPPSYHYALAGQLRSLRKKGVLIIGSGNMVHNLRMVSWPRLNDKFGFDWALEASETMKKHVLNGQAKPLLDYKNQGAAFQLAIPTPEHYLPLIYTMGLQEPSDEISLFNDAPMAGALTMTSVKWG
jgi:4,5-DOPA dioxygenase extradiol